MHIKFSYWRILIVLILSIAFIFSSCDDSSEKDSPKAEVTHYIYSADDLYAIGRNAPGYKGWLLSHEYILMDDIDLTDYTDGSGFQPIGYISVDDYEPFTGIFNGNGYTIRNLKISNRIAGISGPDVTGMFFAIEDGTVSNIIFEDVDIFGDNNTGTVTGRNYGTIQNCSVSGSVQGNDNIGGIVGINNGTLSYCTSTAVLSGYDHIGGLVGKNTDGIITHCQTACTVTADSRIGGLIGSSQSGNISDCNSGGSVVMDNVRSSEYAYAGGLIGYSKNDNIYLCHSTTSISGTGSRAGGLISDLIEGSVSHCFASGNITVNGDYNLGGLVGEADGDSIISDSFASGNVVSISPSTNQFFFGGLVGNNDAAITRCYALGNVSGNTAAYGSYGIGGLAGSNEGSISQCYAKGEVTGYYKVGGLAGGNDGSILNCYATGMATGTAEVGGLIGYNEHSVRNCYAIGLVAGGEYTGGLIGRKHDYYEIPVVRSYYNSETTGHTTSPDSTYYGEPRTTIQLKTESTFTGGTGAWDFDDVWDFDLLINNGYPHLVVFDD